MNLSMLLASAAALLSYAAHDTLPASQPYPLPEGKQSTNLKNLPDKTGK